MADSGTLGQLASLRSGYAFKSSSWKSEGFPVVKIKNVLDGVVSLQGCAYVGSDDAQKAADYLAREGDVLISLTGYVGQVGRVPQGAEVLVNQRVGLVTPHVSEDRSYVYHLLRLLKPQVEELGTGTAQSNVAPRDILELPIPHLSESQRRSVAVVLDEFDEKIRINTLISQNLEHFASKIFRSWFIDFDPVRAKMAGDAPVGMDAETAALFPDSMEDSELGEIPTGWTHEQLGSFARVSGGKQLSKDEFVPGGDVPVLGGAGEMGFTNKSNADGFVITVGRVGVNCGRFVANNGPTWVNNNASRVVPSEAGHEEWLLLALQSLDLDDIKRGAAQPFVSNGDLLEKRIVLPTSEVLESFSSIVKPIFRFNENVKNQNVLLASLRDALLPRLISGELEIPEEMLAA